MIHFFVSKLNRYTNLTFSILLKIIFFFNIYLSLNYFYYRKSYYISSVLFIVYYFFAFQTNITGLRKSKHRISIRLLIL